MNPYTIEGPAIYSFSGGRTSGYLLKHVLDAHGGTLPPNQHVLFANTGREMPETLDFVQQVSQRWNVPITWLEFDRAAPNRTKVVNHNSASRNGEPFLDLIRFRKALPNRVSRFCTVELKILRMEAHAKHELGLERFTNVVGIRADEPKRVKRDAKRSAWTREYPLFDAGIDKHMVVAWWREQEFDLRLESVDGETLLGNCDLCFLKGMSKRRRILRQRPDLAQWWIDAENMIESTKRPGEYMTFVPADRPSYAQVAQYMKMHATLQQEVQGAEDDDEDDCACTD